MKQRRIEDYGNMVQRLYARDTAAENRVCCRNITFQVTSGCNLRCSYCYEHHKSVERMSIETGRKIVDYILDLYEKNESDFVNQNTQAVVLDFIGGEPLLEAKLIERICDYWFSECYRREIPLAPFTRISFATNGKLWFSPAAQHLFAKYHEMMSVTVSIDGVQELHDKYRVDEHGVPLLKPVGSRPISLRKFPPNVLHRRRQMNVRRETAQQRHELLRETR